MMVFSIVLYCFLKNDGVLTALEGGILFIGLIGFLFFLIKTAKKDVET
jgi:cation:H+ antiporter